MLCNKPPQTYWHRTPPIYCAHGFYVSGIQKGHGGDGFSLLLAVWGLSWKDSKSDDDFTAGS